MHARREYPSIQYLRAIAAILVVVHHARNPQPWLFHVLDGTSALTNGVDIFFVISGFIMVHTAAKAAPMEFWRRRIVRIVPLYWMFLALAVAGQVARGAMPSLPDIIRSVLFIPYRNGGHGGAIVPLLVPGWTLNYEMFFYLLFGVGLALKRPVFVTSAAIVALIFGGLALGGPKGAVGMTWTSGIMIEFGMGMVLARLVPVRIGAWAALLLVGGFAALLASDFIPLIHPVGVGLPAAAIVMGAVALDDAGRVPRWRWGLLLGNASYSIYLVHVFVLPLPRALFSRGPLEGWDQLIAYIIVATLVAVLAGLATYRWVEQPLTRSISAFLRGSQSERRPAVETT